MRIKHNVFDICILMFSAVLVYLYARKQLEVQELIMIEQKAKLEMLSKISISDYDIEEVKAIVQAFRTEVPPEEESERVRLPWNNVYMLVPRGSNVDELRKLVHRCPGIRIVLINEDEGDDIKDQFFKRSVTSF